MTMIQAMLLLTLIKLLLHMMNQYIRYLLHQAQVNMVMLHLLENIDLQFMIHMITTLEVLKSNWYGIKVSDLTSN